MASSAIHSVPASPATITQASTANTVSTTSWGVSVTDGTSAGVSGGLNVSTGLLVVLSPQVQVAIQTNNTSNRRQAWQRAFMIISDTAKDSILNNTSWGLNF